METRAEMLNHAFVEQVAQMLLRSEQSQNSPVDSGEELDALITEARGLQIANICLAGE